MSSSATRLLPAVLSTIVAAECLFVSDRLLMTWEGPFVAAAEARVGRPLTPVSYAGVARRTTRRAVAVGAVAAPVVAAPVVAPRCVQAVDPYGRVYTRCY
jgi:uncharacterized MnhB-related membrane protein